MNENEETNTEINATQEAEDAEELESRRRFLKQAGRFALYTPPVITLLMKPSYAQILASGAIKPVDPPPIIKPPKPKK